MCVQWADKDCDRYSTKEVLAKHAGWPGVRREVFINVIHMAENIFSSPAHVFESEWMSAGRACVYVLVCLLAYMLGYKGKVSV